MSTETAEQIQKRWNGLAERISTQIAGRLFHKHGDPESIRMSQGVFQNVLQATILFGLSEEATGKPAPELDTF